LNHQLLIASNCTNKLLVIYLPADGYFVWFDAVKLRDIFTRVQFQVIHSLRREPSLVPLADFFFGWDRTHEDFVCMYMFCFDSDRLLG